MILLISALPQAFVYFLVNFLFPIRARNKTLFLILVLEAEYRAMTDNVAKVVCLCRLLFDMVVSLRTPTSIYCDNYCDNQSALMIAKITISLEQSKEIDIDSHFVNFYPHTLPLPYISAMEQLADFFIKTCTIAHYQYLPNKLSVVDPYEFEGVLDVDTVYIIYCTYLSCV